MDTLSKLKEIAKQYDLPDNTPISRVAGLYSEMRSTHGLNKYIPDDVTGRMAELTADKVARLKKLAEENAELKKTLKEKEATIARFKEWQKNMANYKALYWLREGIKLAEKAPMSTPLLEILRQFIGVNASYDKRLNKLITLHKDYINKGIALLEAAHKEGYEVDDT